jgi:hypothetical protein
MRQCKMLQLFFCERNKNQNNLLKRLETRKMNKEMKKKCSFWFLFIFVKK